MINALIWRLPHWIHERLIDLTGWRLVRVTADGKVRGYYWTNKYPAWEEPG